MTDLASIIIAIISLVIIWAIVSIPVWISAKIFAPMNATSVIFHLGGARLCRNHAFDRFSQSFLEAYNTMDIEGIQVC